MKTSAIRSRIIKMFLGLTIISSLSHCKKFLDEKSKRSDLVPTTIDQLQPLLDNNNVNGSDPYLLEVVADNFYLKASDWNSRSTSSGAQHYIWKADALPETNSWRLPYSSSIYYSNIILDQLPGVKYGPSEQEKYNALKGSCLFYRAFSFFSLAQLYAKPYSTENANSLGLVLRLTSNPNVRSTRATVKETYDQIINDLITAVDLLPVSTVFPSRPSKIAAYALLARVYLSMREYQEAGKYADLALQLKNELLDFNTLVNPLSSPPIGTFNTEVIYHAYSTGNAIISANIAKIDTNLIKSYSDDDLRKIVFFRPNTGANTGTYAFRGSYNGNLAVDNIFTGLTTGELYLVRAECFARAGKVSEALADLNTLMKKRWSNSVPYVDITASDAADALNKILTERRKELVFRGQRWTDIRRLNLEGANITLTRVIGSTVYTLPPNDLRTVMLIPVEEITRSGIQQNPR